MSVRVSNNGGGTGSHGGSSHESHQKHFAADSLPSTRSEEVVNFYQVLGLDQQIARDPTQVKSAYRKLAKLYHPDANPHSDAAEKFHEISEAYEMLSGRDVRGQNIRFDLPLEYPAVIRGGSHYLRVHRMDTCETCQGIGVVLQERQHHQRPKESAPPELTTVPCPCCNNDSGDGAICSSCPVCDGTGVVLKEQPPPRKKVEIPKEQVTCRTCLGQGVVEMAKRVPIELPAFDPDEFEPPQTHRDPKVVFEVIFPGEGDVGPKNGPPGDLHVFVHVKPLDRRTARFTNFSP